VTLQRAFQQGFGKLARQRLYPGHIYKAAYAIANCRTANLGGHVQECENGHVQGVWYNSCRHRSCPQCTGLQGERWRRQQAARLLACDHYHVVFTVPHELNALWRFNKERMAQHLFRCARDTLIELLGDPKYLGALPGIIATLHTWGRTLSFHPHLHCLVTGGGWEQGRGWKPAKPNFLLPVRVVKALFRGKMLAAVRSDLGRGKLVLPPDHSPARMDNLIRMLYEKKWNVRLAERYEHGHGVVKYLARYVRGGPFSNTQIRHLDADTISFRYKDHRDQKRKILTLSLVDFLDRFLAHVPATGFRAVRTYGLYVAQHHDALNQCRKQLGQCAHERPAPLEWHAYLSSLGLAQLAACSLCGGTLQRGAKIARSRLGQYACREGAG